MIFERVHRRTVLAAIGFLIAAGVAAADQQPDYLLGPEDMFTITVWGPGGVSERFTVEADGTFTFPILGRVKAGGLTARQLQDELITRLRDGYFNDPKVTVVVEAYKSQRIFVVGEVKTPGTYTLTRPTTLVEALTLAGLPTPNAGPVVLLRRRTNGEPSQSPVTQSGADVSEIRVDLAGLQEGVLSNNPLLRDGDTIALPRAAPVYVFGYVGRPGEYLIGREATVRQILSLAGGVTQRGAVGRVKVLRTTGGTEHEVKVELDDRVMPGDTIVVPERFF
jgi:polysaccharide export outer membrane protein